MNLGPVLEFWGSDERTRTYKHIYGIHITPLPVHVTTQHLYACTYAYITQLTKNCQHQYKHVFFLNSTQLYSATLISHLIAQPYSI